MASAQAQYRYSVMSNCSYHCEQSIHRYHVVTHPTDELLHDFFSASGGNTDEFGKQ